jgi:hypothetical protein
MVPAGESDATKISPVFKSGRRVRVAAAILVVVGLVLAAPFWHKAADHFHYALPGRVPDRVAHNGRDYIYPGPCISREEIARQYGSKSLRRIGTIWGWLTSPRGLYMPAGVKGQPGGVFVSGGLGEDCLVPYRISGST